MEKKSLREFQIFDESKFTKRVVFQNGEGSVFLLNFMPDQALPAHAHPGAAVSILVLEGGGTVQVDGEKTEVARGDMIRVEGEEKLSFENTGPQRTSLYVFLTKIPDERN